MNRHARVIQQRKIAHLEARLARLEREAGRVDDFVDDVKSLGRRILNIPKNMVGAIVNALEDALKTIAVDLEKDMELRKEIAGSLLGTRIHRAMVGVLPLSTADIPTLHKFDKANPIKSLFVGGPAGIKPTPLSVLANMYEGEEQKRIKGAFQSWFADYKSVFGAPKSGGFKLFLEYAKKYSKTLYRLFTVLNSMGLISSLPSPLVFILQAGVATIHNFIVVFNPEIINGPNFRNIVTDTLIESPVFLLNMVLALIEKAFYKWGVSTDMFDEMAGKTASYHRRVASTSYPRIASVINYLEAQAI
jgi:hypothetical protein